MPFFNGKETMGLEASLKLLDLSPDATIEDANQAYTYLHQMIDRFYQDGSEKGQGSREEDMDLLTRAYEKAIAYFSDCNLPSDTSGEGPFQASAPAVAGPTDLHFTINFDNAEEGAVQRQIDTHLPEPNSGTVEDAIAITQHRLRQAEKDLPAVQEAVQAAASEVKAAGRRHAQAQRSRINAAVAAKSAKSRALLLEIEAQRTMDEAIAIAEKARDRAAAARKAASQARQAAKTARQEAVRIQQSEKTAAAEIVCAEDQLDRRKARLQDLTHTVVEARNQMRMFQAIRAEPIGPGDSVAESLIEPHPVSRDVERQQVLSDLLAIEASLQAGTKNSLATDDGSDPSTNRTPPDVEQRQHPRIVYPPDRHPVLSIDGRPVSVLDVSTAGMRLQAEDVPDGLRIVRGTVALGDASSLPVTGKVVRQDAYSLGVRLVTRIGRRILDQERMRLSA